ncbi:MAG: hypothetical protein JNJ77_21190 [Planctomycetia bacterium]|nr:hypothetical protein [Planctomycetia bacterium]
MFQHRVNCKYLVIMALWLAIPEDATAQPMRQLPGVRPFLAGQLPQQGQPNSRTRPAPNSVGLESTDFYPKNGYPKQLGDAIELGAAMAGGAGGAAGGVAGNNGNTGVQAAGSMGFQGNTGNQIGQNTGGTILGGLFGGGGGVGGGTGFRTGNQNSGSASGFGFTGGGFTGAVPKGFGFGGSPQTPDWKMPLHGVVR